MQRARHFAINMAIAHYPRTDRRLLLLLWHLAHRWGRVMPDGIHLPLRLTHDLLSDLVASRRPSVTTGLGPGSSARGTSPGRATRSCSTASRRSNSIPIYDGKWIEVQAIRHVAVRGRCAPGTFAR